MVADFLIVKLGKVKQQYWNVTVSVIAVVLSVLMIMERI